MDDQIRMRECDGVEDVEKQSDAPAGVERLRGAVPIDVLAVHVFEDQIRLTAGRDAGVDELRDVRVSQPPEDRAFTCEAFLAAPAERDVQELDRRAAFESAVAALGEPDGAHAALADRRDERVGRRSSVRPESPVDRDWPGRTGARRSR